MPGKRKETMDIRELLRYIQHGESDRAVEKATGVNRKTVARYREWATEQGLLEEALPPLGELHRLLKETMNTTPPPQNTSSVEPYRELVTALRERGVEMAAIHQRLIEQGYTGSYSSVRRFVRKLEPVTPEAMVRVETLPGEEGQVDFGFAGELVDPETGELRRAWAFVMALSWSRHQYVEFVFNQKLETWLRLHRNAFSFFGGVPERVVVDNLKAAIVKACFHEPQAQHSYRECAEHYGFLIAACRPYTPRHKGKVEKGGVHYVKRNFLAGRDTMSITEAYQKVLRWVNDVAGQRRHGTTKEVPLARFEVERPQLQPLPDTPYDLAIWKHIKKLHADCYVVFEDAYYSVPWRLIEQPLWVCGCMDQRVSPNNPRDTMHAGLKKRVASGKLLGGINHLKGGAYDERSNPWHRVYHRTEFVSSIRAEQEEVETGVQHRVGPASSQTNHRCRGSAGSSTGNRGSEEAFWFTSG